jgi:hypothetical protein
MKGVTAHLVWQVLIISGPVSIYVSLIAGEQEDKVFHEKQDCSGASPAASNIRRHTEGHNNNHSNTTDTNQFFVVPVTAEKVRHSCPCN